MTAQDEREDGAIRDRVLAQDIWQAIPRQRRHVRAHRAFLVRVVEHLVGEAGVRQLVDVGAGPPTSPSVHEVAQAIAPGTRVVYVDNDPAVMAQARALVPGSGGGQVGFVRGDLRYPPSITRHRCFRELIDPGEPTAVLLLAVLPSLTDADRPHAVVEELLRPLAPGSYLAATHTTADFDPPGMAEQVAAAQTTGLPFVPRDRASVEEFFHGLELVEPGVVPVLAWRPRSVTADPRSVPAYAGLGRTG